MDEIEEIEKTEETEEQEQKQEGSFRKGVLTGIACTLAVGICAGVGWKLGESRQNQNVFSDKSHMEKLLGLENLIDQYYLEDKDEDQLAEGLYKGLIFGLGDVYSKYYTAEEYADITRENSGEYTGIGILMEKCEDGSVLVVQCYEDSPCARAGVREGDRIWQVDGRNTEEMSLGEISASVQEEGKESLVLSIERQDVPERLEITVPVGTVELSTVQGELLENQVGYVKISEFKGVTFRQYEEKIEELQDQGMKKLIIDLRDNPGGLFDSVCDVLGQILPEGLIVYTEDKYGVRNEEYCDGEHPLDLPLAVLINENSASASEIFAGAVKDYGVGTLVGKTTYGKGIVQTIRELNDGSAVKLTISKYYTPSGNNIHQVGIQPDVEVEQGQDDQDLQLEKALELLAEAE